MNISGTFKRITCLFLCLFTVSSVFIPSVFAEKEVSSTDFSHSQKEKIKIAPSVILKKMYPDEISDAEVQYVDTYFETVFLYSADISPDNVSVRVDGDSITVKAKESSYKAENGTSVNWIPKKAVYGETEVELDSDYSCSLQKTSSAIVQVSYECELSVPKSYILGLSNFAYNDQVSAKATENEHSDALSEYLQAVSKYTAYCDELEQYGSDLARYEEYLEQKAIYDEALASYNRYLSALTQYEKELSAYQKYTEELKLYDEQKAAYEKAYEENRAEYEEYRRYVENLQRIRTSMYAMESMFLRPSNGVGPLYNALQNKELVTMIEKYDDELVTFYGVKRENIVEMRTVSDELNEMLRAYNDAREQSEEAAFNYYFNNYSAITEKFNYLYDKMTAVLTDTIYVHVCALIEVEYKSQPDMATYKKWRIRNVLCHIYLICQVLDDSSTASEIWSFYLENGEAHQYNFADLLAQNVILSDTNSANPKDLRWWSGNIPATNLPKAPTKPLEVKEPIPPLEVTEPTEPVKVTEPTEPVKVSAPSTRPQIDNYELVLRVEDAFSNTQLKSRQALSEYTLTLTSEVNRAFSSDGSQITAYYGSSGEILSINQQPESLTKQSTEQYDYTFSQWNRITVNENDIIMLPEFEVAERSYTVRFTHPDDPDFQATAQYKYGELPQYMGETPIRAATETAVFSFAGWFPQPHAVTGDVTYTAQFNEEQRLYTVSWNILGKTQSRSLPFGASPIIPSVRNEIYEDGTLYTFNGWDKTPSTVTQDVTYTAKFSKETLVSLPTDTEGNVSLYSSDTSYFLTTDAQEAEISELLRRVKADGKQLRINMQDFTLIIPNSAVSSLCSYNTSVLSVISSNEGVGYVFYNFSGSPIRFDSEIRMILPCDEASSDNVYVSSLDSSGYASTLSCSVFEDSVEFISAQSTYYKPVKYYTLSLEYGDGGAVFAPNTLYTKGSTLDLQILPNGEFAVGKVTVTYSDGSFLEYSSAEGLTMPADNVKIKIEFETKKYTIKFICNGELFSTGYFALGEVIEVPDIPLSFEKDGFLYTFIGWSEPISIATKDMTFTAKYFCVNKEDVTPADTQTAVNKVLVDQVLPVVICAVLIAAAITVPLVVVSKKKRASKDADDAQADASAENGKGEDDESEI